MTTDTLRLIANGLYIAAALFLVLALVLFWYYRIPAVIGDLSGKTARKSIIENRKSREKANRKRASANPVNSSSLSEKINKMAQAEDDRTMPLEQPGDATMPLSMTTDATMPLTNGAEETMPLNQNYQTNFSAAGNEPTLQFASAYSEQGQNTAQMTAQISRKQSRTAASSYASQESDRWNTSTTTSELSGERIIRDNLNTQLPSERTGYLVDEYQTELLDEGTVPLNGTRPAAQGVHINMIDQVMMIHTNETINGLN